MRNIVIILLSLYSFILGSDTLHLHCGTSPNDKVTSFLYSLFDIIMDSMGREKLYHHYPAARAALYLESGKIDIDIARVYEFQNESTNSIRIPVPYFKTALHAYTIDTTLIIQREGIPIFSSQKGLNVDYRRGTVASKNYAEQHLKEADVYVVNTVNSGMDKLFAQRSDIFISPKPVVEWWMRKNSDKADAVHSVKVSDIEIYAYLSRHQQTLLPDITRIMKTLAEDGTIKELYDKHMGSGSDFKQSN